MKPYVKYALITVCVLIIWTLIQYISGLDRSDAGKYLSWISYPIMIFFIVLTLREEKSLNGGYLSFGEGFKNGLLMMTVVALIMSIFTYIYFTYINPDFADFVSEKAREEMENRDLSDEEIEKAMDVAQMFMSVNFMTLMALVGNVVIGAIFSMIVSAIMKKERPGQ